MSLPALQMDESPSPQTGVARAARLMRLLGPAAAGVWNELSAGETAHLRRAMTAGELQPTDEDAALFISELERPEPYAPPEEQSVWQRLSDCEPDAIAASIAPEHPQTIALILSRMNAAHAALTVRALPRDIAVSALRRLLHAGRPDSESLALIENALGRQIDAQVLKSPCCRLLRKATPARASVFARSCSPLTILPRWMRRQCRPSCHRRTGRHSPQR
jgi:flagellar motor switch protein FliG